MLSVTQIDYIRHLRDVEGASISEIAARVKCDWKTAKKYADGSVDLRQRGRRARKKTAMEGFEEYIEAWLLEDERLLLLITLFDRILLTIGGRQRQSIAPA